MKALLFICSTVIFSFFVLLEKTSHSRVNIDGFINQDEKGFYLDDIESGAVIYLEFIAEEEKLILDDFSYVNIVGLYHKSSNTLHVETMGMR